MPLFLCNYCNRPILYFYGIIITHFHKTENADTFTINKKREAGANSFVLDVTARKIIFITAKL